MILRPFETRDRHWVAAAHRRHYREVEGFDARFDAAVEASLNVLEQAQGVAASRYLVAEVGRRRAGCIFLAAEDEGAGRIRLFYLDAAHRGAGHGQRMLDEVLAHATQAGLSTVRVSTFERHRAACALYERAGFRRVAEVPVTAFGQDMTRVDFECDPACRGARAGA